MSISVYAYNPASAGAKALGFNVLKHENSRFKGNDKKLVVNWGASEVKNQEVFKCKILNKPEEVAKVANKLSFFEDTQGTDQVIPPFTTEVDVVQSWLNAGNTVVARTKLNGHSGEGIVLLEPGMLVVPAPLYTMYIKKKSEFRVHFFNKEVIFVQQKVRRQDHPEELVNWKIRNHDNGFNFAWNNIDVPEAVYETVYRYLDVSGLDFGAIDIIYNEKQNVAYMLEINTAPGLEGETLARYQREIQKAYIRLARIKTTVTTQVWGNIPDLLLAKNMVNKPPAQEEF